MGRSRGLLHVLAALTFAVGAPLPGQIAVQMGVLVRPDTVRIGDPFHVLVAVRAPAGATVEFPRTLDSTATVQSLDPSVTTATTDARGVRVDADYRVAAWDVGHQPIPLGDVVVRLGSIERRVPITGYAVYVASVLPVDSAQRLPKPARPLIEPTLIPWWIWALLAAVVALIGLLAWWWTHRRPPERSLAMTEPYARAMREFARVEALALLEAGERGRYVALTVEVLRGYLAERLSSAPLSLSTGELVLAMASVETVDHERLDRVLTEADLIKFARRSVSAEGARELAREIRAVVDAEHAAAALSMSQPTGPTVLEEAA